MHPAVPGPYAVLERKIDLLLRELHVDTSSLATDMALPPDVQALLTQGQKIQAIKLYREHTDVGLKEAKDAVEGHGGPSPWMLLERKLNLILGELGIEDDGGPVAPRADSANRVDKVELLLRRGDTIGAIKAYREKTGTGLKEAKDAVDAMAARLRGSDR